MAVKISSESSTSLSEIKPGDFVTFHRHRNVYYVQRIHSAENFAICESVATITKLSHHPADVEFDFLEEYYDVPVKDLVKFVGTITIECT